MAGTEIDTGAVARAGETYSTVADGISTAASRVRGYVAAPPAFGRAYADQGQRYGEALDALAAATESWRDGSRAVGKGLRNSATAHTRTDVGGAGAVKGAGSGR